VTKAHGDSGGRGVPRIGAPRPPERYDRDQAATTATCNSVTPLSGSLAQ
jgi:hypothetical protein